jgi:hypothetical protein
LEIPVLVRHDPGCKWGRFSGEVDARANILSGGFMPGHTDAAKRFADVYNLHKATGQARGWIAVRLADGDSDGEVYETRADAVFWCRHSESWYFFAALTRPPMTICQAESLLRYKRVMNQIEAADRDAPHGGMEVVRRLTIEDEEAQIRAVETGRGFVAMGYRR